MMPLKNLIILLVGIGAVTALFGYIGKSSTSPSQPSVSYAVTPATYTTPTISPLDLSSQLNMLKSIQMSCDISGIGTIRGQLSIKNGNIRFASSADDKQVLFVNKTLYTWTVGNTPALAYENKSEQDDITTALTFISGGDASTLSALQNSFAQGSFAKMCASNTALSDSLFVLPATLQVVKK